MKRRTVAKEMCEAGRVLVNGREAGPAKETRVGDTLTIKYSTKNFELEIIGIPARPGKAVPEEMYRVISERRMERADETW